MLQILIPSEHTLFLFNLQSPHVNEHCDHVDQSPIVHLVAVVVGDVGREVHLTGDGVGMVAHGACITSCWSLGCPLPHFSAEPSTDPHLQGLFLVLLELPQV